MTAPLATPNMNLLLVEQNHNHLDTFGGKIPLLHNRFGGVHA
jgi:hypothetical protein